MKYITDSNGRLIFLGGYAVANAVVEEPIPVIPVELATVTTASITAITYNSASCGGNVTSDGGAAVTAKGVCWNTGGNPTTADSSTNNGTGTGSFISSLTGLSASTGYHVKAYAVNSAGIAYGSQVDFSTLKQFPTSGCLAYWKLDETTGTLADSATGSYDGTYVGTPTLGAAGIIGNAVTTTTAKYVNCGVISVGDALSISAWGKMDAASNARIIISRWYNNDSIITGSGKFLFGINGTYVDSGVATDTAWHHFVGTYNKDAGSNQLKIYVDGIYKNAATLSSSVAYNAKIWGLGDDTFGSGTWPGLIDEVGIWNRALTQAEVTALYNGGAGLTYAPA